MSELDTQEFFRIMDDKEALQKAMEDNPSHMYPTAHKRYAAILQKYLSYTGVIVPGMNMEGLTLADIMGNSEMFQKNRMVGVARIFKNNAKKGRPFKSKDDDAEDNLKLVVKSSKKKTYMPACVLKTVKQNVKDVMLRQVKEEITADEEKKKIDEKQVV